MTREWNPFRSIVWLGDKATIDGESYFLVPTGRDAEFLYYRTLDDWRADLNRRIDEARSRKSD